MYEGVEMTSNILILFGLADHYIMDTTGITLPFMFSYVTPSIIKMCHLIQLQNVQDALLVLWFEYSIIPTISNWQVGRDCKSVPRKIK